MPTGNALGPVRRLPRHRSSRLDFGVSYTFYPQIVSASSSSTALPYTLVLVGLVTIIAFILGTLLGVLAAWKRGTWLDTAAHPRRLVHVSAFPYFWTALLLLFFLGYVLQLVPDLGRLRPDGDAEPQPRVHRRRARTTRCCRP